MLPCLALGSCEQVRAWLVEAQGQLLTTQAALQEREAECRALSERVAALTDANGVGKGGTAVVAAQESRDALLVHNLALAAQLAEAASEQEVLAQLSTTGYELAHEVSAAGGARPSSAASNATSLPDTPGTALARDVSAVLELMRQTRSSLADRLAHSRQACESMIAELQLGGARLAPVNDVSGPACKLEEQAVVVAAEASSPTPTEPDSLAAEPSLSPAVLGTSARFNVVGSPVAVWPSGKKPAGRQGANSERTQENRPTMAYDCGAADDAGAGARAWVRQLQATHAPFDLPGFLSALGCQGVDPVKPLGRSEWAAAKEAGLAALAGAALAADEMAGNAAAEQRAAADEAARVLQAWEWPVGRVAMPQPDGLWAKMMGLHA